MVKRVTPVEAEALLKEGWTYLDVRSIPEFDGGHPVGASDVVTGSTRSMLTGSLVPTVVLPARSLTAAVAVSPVPLSVITVSAGQAAP